MRWLGAFLKRRMWRMNQTIHRNGGIHRRRCFTSPLLVGFKVGWRSLWRRFNTGFGAASYWREPHLEMPTNWSYCSMSKRAFLLLLKEITDGRRCFWLELGRKHSSATSSLISDVTSALLCRFLNCVMLVGSIEPLHIAVAAGDLYWTGIFFIEKAGWSCNPGK